MRLNLVTKILVTILVLNISGVSHLITQLFFDNRVFYEFRERAVRAGIRVPIEAGIMPIVNKNQVERTVTMCGASVPPKMARFISKYCDDPVALKDAGLFYATEQIMDLGFIVGCAGQNPLLRMTERRSPD